VFDWLFEGRPTVYLVLATAAVILLALWWKARKRKYLIAVGVVAALAGVYYLLDASVESDREQIVRKVREMAAGVKAGDADKVFANVSDQFRRPSGTNKQQFRERAKPFLTPGRFTDVAVWEFQHKEEPSRAERKAVVAFMVKIRGGGTGAEDVPYRCTATFVLDTDDQWRLQSFTLLNPLGTDEMPLPF